MYPSQINFRAVLIRRFLVVFNMETRFIKGKADRKIKARATWVNQNEIEIIITN